MCWYASWLLLLLCFSMRAYTPLISFEFLSCHCTVVTVTRVDVNTSCRFLSSNWAKILWLITWRKSMPAERWWFTAVLVVCCSLKRYALSVVWACGTLCCENWTCGWQPDVWVGMSCTTGRWRINSIRKYIAQYGEKSVIFNFKSFCSSRFIH